MASAAFLAVMLSGETLFAGTDAARLFAGVTWESRLFADPIGNPEHPPLSYEDDDVSKFAGLAKSQKLVPELRAVAAVVVELLFPPGVLWVLLVDTLDMPVFCSNDFCCCCGPVRVEVVIGAVGAVDLTEVRALELAGEGGPTCTDFLKPG